LDGAARASSTTRGRAEGRLVRNGTILTTDPADAITPIHDRMPVILLREVRGRWLPLFAKRELLAMLVPHDGPFVIKTPRDWQAGDAPHISAPADGLAGTRMCPIKFAGLQRGWV
jgi:hypothetical protein